MALVPEIYGILAWKITIFCNNSQQNLESVKVIDRCCHLDLDKG